MNTPIQLPTEPFVWDEAEKSMPLRSQAMKSGELKPGR